MAKYDSRLQVKSNQACLEIFSRSIVKFQMPGSRSLGPCVMQVFVELEIPHIYHSVARNSPKRQELTDKWNVFQVPYIEVICVLHLSDQQALLCGCTMQSCSCGVLFAMFQAGRCFALFNLTNPFRSPFPPSLPSLFSPAYVCMQPFCFGLHAAVLGHKCPWSCLQGCCCCCFTTNANSFLPCVC